MIITCPDCATSYEIPDTVIDDEGKLVQCEECRTIWTHFEPQPETELSNEQSFHCEALQAADLTDQETESSGAGFYRPSHEDGPLLDCSADTMDSSEVDHESIETLEFEEIPGEVPGTALAIIEPPTRQTEPPPGVWKQ